MKTAGGAVNSDQTLKLRRQKSREVSSRFLSPSSNHSVESGIRSPNHTVSPLRHKPRTSTDTRKHRSLEDGGIIRGLWPSSATTSSTPSQSSNKTPGTLADHLGNDRLKDLMYCESYQTTDKSMPLDRQRSCTEFSRFGNEREISKENRKPFFGGSMRYTGKLRFPGRSSASSSSQSSSLISDKIIAGRLSVDENALSRKSLIGLDSDTQDSESECSDMYSGTSFDSPVIGKKSSALYMASTASSRKSGREVPSKYMNDLSSKSQRWISNSKVSSENSTKKFTIKKAMKRASSLTTYGSATSKWALSPGRSGSPPMSVENKGTPMSFSSLKPPSSPSRAKGVGNFLSLGLDLFKSKKSSSSHCSSPSGPIATETVHQLRLLHNRLVQWRYANAKADAVNVNITNQTQSNLLCAWDSLTKLKYSVVQKKLQLEKEKLEMKLNFILCSQIKPLEAWGEIERQHLSAVSMTKDCLNSVVCRVPFIEGAKVEPQSTYIVLRHASDVTDSIKLMLSTFSPSAEKTVSILSELAEVVAQEKALLEECLELSRVVSTLEIQERSLKCVILQLKLWEEQQQQYQQRESFLITA